MKNCVIAFLLAATATACGGAQDATTGQTGGKTANVNTLDISNGWKFRTGDDPKWSQRSCDDSAWDDIELGEPWEELAHADYDGHAWYRKQMLIPAHFKESADFRQCRRLLLSLGRIDAEVQTWFNGQAVGQPGTANAAHHQQWRKDQRVIEIPGKLVRWGGANIVALRVYAHTGKRAAWTGTPALAVPDWRRFVTISVGTRSEDGIFRGSEWMQVHAAINNRTFTTMKGQLVWKIETDEQKPLKQTSIPISIDAGRQKQAYCPLHELPGPGFYRVTGTFKSSSPDGTLSDSMTVGYAPLQIDHAMTRAADFNEFWKQALRELHEITPQYKLILQNEQSNEKRDLYLVEMLSLSGLTVRGWYEVPKKPGRHPALLRLPGYGSSMRPVNRFDDMVVLSFNIRSHGNSDEAPGAPLDLWLRGLDSEEEYYYRGAYMDCIRAVDFLASRSEVDPDRIAVWGGSQGGGLSLMTAALDKRISLCMADVPWLCDWVKYFKASHWDEIDDWLAADPRRSWATMLRTLSYFDTANMTERIRCPVLMRVGLQDNACPPATCFASFNKIRSPSEYLVYPNAGHRLGREQWESGHKWLRERLGLQP